MVKPKRLFNAISLIAFIFLLTFWQIHAVAATFTSCGAVTDMPEAQCNTLVALYDNTDGDNWTNNDGWKVTDTPCSWYGVACADSAITRIELRENNLTGSLPELSALTSLMILDFHDNQLSGPIPELSALTSLMILDFYNSQLSGPIPELSALTNLWGLDLSNNQLSGSIPELSALTSLLILYLNNNQLSGPIPALNTLTSLQNLGLTGNPQLCQNPDADYAGRPEVDEFPLCSPVVLFCADVTEIPEAQCNTLVALYDSTDGDNWTNKDGWVQTHTPCSWYGVTCADSAITRIELIENNLTGALPELNSLTSLQVLQLNDNQLSGPFPDVSALTTTLQGVYLRANQISGPIPTYLSTLTSLVGLDLGGNQLSGQIPDLSGLTNLVNLWLYDNQLSGPIPELSALTNLHILNLSNNELSGPIPELSALTLLESLAFNGNQLTGPIPSLSTLTNLRILYLHENQLSGPIPQLSTLTQLEQLYLSTNQLTGTIPDLSALTHLEKLWLADNQLSGPIPDLSALTNLMELYLHVNQLSGPIPELSAMTNLREINLNGNQLTGSIPELGALTNLEVLSFPANQLTGPIPELSALTNLRYLHLGDNQLMGVIPDLTALTQLEKLWLHKNQLSGPIPDLSTLTQLQFIYLNENQLSGPIPDLSALTQLQQLRLYKNQLSGPIPDLSALTQLQILFLSENQLSGPIPDLSALTQLEQLTFAVNELTGPIPALSTLTNLMVFYLHENQLSGPIPDLSTLTKLEALYLHNNQLSGPIPELSTLTKLERLYLKGNQLTGPIPDLSALTNLRILYLHENQLSGPIPQLSALTQLEQLYLSTNQLTGTIPELSALTKLERLYLHTNQLTGSIPELSALTNLVKINLNSNQLSGPIPDLSNLTKLQNLHLADNLQLSGPIPDLSALTDLRTLSLNNNQLTGPFPDVSALTQLQWLKFGDNLLTGPISDLSNLTNLEVLYLSNAQLSGSIPELSTLTGLTQLYLNNNQLSGPIPALNMLTKLTILELTGNQLCQDTDANYGSWPQVDEFPVCGNPAIILTSPVHGATDIPVSGQVFTWVPAPGASSHRIVISTLADFAGFTEDGGASYCHDTTTCLTAAAPGMQDYTVAVNLAENTTHYWKVRANIDPLNWSEVRSLTTGTAPQTGCNGDIQLPDNLCDGLATYYPFDGNATDASGNGNDGTVNGATLTEDRFGNANSAYSFDGNGSYINVGGIGNLASVSAAFWVRPEEGTYSNYRNPFGLGGLDGSDRFRAEFANDWNGHKFYAFFGSGSCGEGGGCSYIGPTDYDEVPINQWTFIVMVHNNTNNQNQLYINGELRYTSTHEVVLQPAILTIGLGFKDIPERYFKGKLDDFHVYNRTLSAAEIQTHYNATKPATTGCNGDTQLPDNLCDGLTAYYPFDGNATDASGNGNDGVLQGDIAFVKGVSEQAAAFDGNGDYISITDRAALDLEQLTFSMFINARHLSDEVFTENGPNGLLFKEKAYVFRVLQSKLDHDFHNGTKWDGIIDPEIRLHHPQDPLSLDNWYFVALTFDGNVTKYFVDGELVETIARSVPINNSDSELRIGWQWDNRYWDGLIDELRIHNRALLDAEVQTLYNATKPTTGCNGDIQLPDNLCDGLATYYPFDSNATDASGNGHDGIEHGGVNYVTGILGKALNLQVEGDYVEIPSSQAINLNTPNKSISVWFKTENLFNKNNAIFDKTDYSDYVLRVPVSNGDHQLDFWVHNNDNDQYDTISTPVSPNTWYHAAIVKAANELTLYLNGSVINSLEVSEITTKDNALIVGAGGSPYFPGYIFNGKIDELYFYNRALSEAEIQTHYNATKPVPPEVTLEDAEDGTTTGWTVYDEKPGGAAISNVFDSDINSQVIELTGDSQSGYQLTQADGSPFANTTHFIAQWRMKITAGNKYTVHWQVKTNEAVTYISYYNYGPLGCYLNQNYVRCGLDNALLDGQWHTITRDLVADLKAVDPSLELLEIDSFKIRMAGRVDDIKLLKREAVDFYTLQGKITDENGQPVSGLSLSGADCQPTDNNGDYQCSVPAGWFGTLVVPEHSPTRFFVPLRRTYSDISEHFTEQDFTAKPIKDGLVGYWHFNNCDATDNSGNGFDGLIHSEPTCVDGTIGKGWQFDGIDDFIEINGGNVLANPVITTAAWVYKAADTKGRVLEKIDHLYRNGDNYHTGVHVPQTGTGRIFRIGTEDSTTGQDYYATYQVESENAEWVHVVSVLTAEYQAIYINGELKSLGNLPAGFVPFMGDAPLQIGGTPLSNHGNKDTKFFNSVIDEVYVYNRVLTDAEIQALYSMNTDCNVVTEIPTAQCEALLALYNSTDGANWINNDDWNITNTPCSWHGVSCDNGNVVGIKLNHNNLAGTLPNISALTELRILQLADNLLTGVLPNFSVFSQLADVWLSKNQFSGTIPELTGLSQLWHFHVWNNQLTGTIPDLSTLTNLQKLDLGKNQLTGTIPELKTLTQLQRLKLSENKLDGPIPGLSELTSLQELYLTDNNHLCRDPNADYAGWTEVDEFSVCASVPLEAQPSVAAACIGQPFDITVKKLLSQAVDGLWLGLSFDTNHLQVNRITNSGVLSSVSTNEFDNTAGTLQFAASNVAGEPPSEEFDFVTVNFTPLALNVGTELPFNPAQTGATLNNVNLSYQTYDVTLAIEDCLALVLPPPLPDNNPIWTVVDMATGLNEPKGISVDLAGNVYVADTNNHRILKVDIDGNPTVIAGIGIAGYSGDEGPATEAKLNTPQGVAIDEDGNLYIADSHNNIIRQIDSNGVIRTVAGSRKGGNSGDGGPAIDARLNKPANVVISSTGDLYIVDTRSSRIRKVDSEGIITKFAGTHRGYRGDGGIATNAKLYWPLGLAFDKTGNAYIADTKNHRVRKVDLRGIITTVAGTGTAGDSGDGGPATAAQLNAPTSVVLDRLDNLYIADRDNHRVRKVDSNGLISTVAGNGNQGTSQEGVLATVAELNSPWGLALANNGNLYLADSGNNIIRKVGTQNDDEAQFNCNTVTEIATAECFALIALYDSTNGEQWTQNNGWKTTDTPCSWDGINCTDGTVTAVDLSDNQLVGELPNLLNSLTNVETFNLSNNQLSGEIPDLSLLDQLQTVQLDHNGLTGPMPELSTSVEEVYLAENNLSGTIPDLSLQTELRVLDLSNNRLGGALPETAFPDSLETLKLDGNQLCTNGPPIEGLEACPEENQIPTASFTATPLEGQVPLTVQLDARTSIDPYGTIVAYHWTLSDGRTLTGLMPTITFGQSGSYEISLEVEDDEGTPSLNLAEKTVTVAPALNKPSLTLLKSGGGLGGITVKQGGENRMNCNTACQEQVQDFPLGSELLLQANTAKGSIFTGWSDDCSGTNRRFTLTMDAPKRCTANFALELPAPLGTYTLTINTIGSTGGTGTLEVNDLRCEEPCISNHKAGRNAKITAIPDPHAYFAAWAGDCSSNDPTIRVAMTSDKSCTAVFGNDSDIAAEQMTEEFQEEGYLEDGRELTEVYPPSDNNERYQEVFRLVENVIIKIDEHLLLTGSWPHQFHGIEWYDPMPESLYTKSIQIISEGTEVELESGPVYVEGDYLKVEVELLNNEGIEEVLPILVYYGEPPISVFGIKRRGGGYACWPMP